MTVQGWTRTFLHDAPMFEEATSSHSMMKHSSDSWSACLEDEPTMRRNGQCGWNAMIPMPNKATAAPVASQAVGRTPSTAHNQAMAVPMYTPP